MKSIFKSLHPLRRADSFKFAFKGIFHTLMNEPNFRIQLLITSIVVALGIRFKISFLEWAVLTMVSGNLLAAEMVNTVVEEFMDHLLREYHNGAKVIKDVAAGFVLVNAIAAAIVFLLLFGPRVAL